MLQETTHNQIAWSVDSLFEIDVEASRTPESAGDLRAIRDELRREIAHTRTMLREEFYGLIKQLDDDRKRRTAPLPVPW